MLAKIGLNAHGFGVCLNILRSTYRRRAARRSGARAAARPAQAHRACATPSHSLRRWISAVRPTCCARTAAAKRRAWRLRPRECAWCEATARRCATPIISSHPEAAGWQAALLSSISTVPRLDRARQHAASRPRHGIEDLKRLLRDESADLLSICRKPDLSLPPEAQHRDGGLGDHGTRARRDACRARCALARRVPARRARLTRRGSARVAPDRRPATPGCRRSARGLSR